ncbi:hypothetical protein FSP39_000461 [Pinctada imbricata]|uniref:Alpha-1,3-glucosyltransferase n=1 Tax=Pinctada imbricata TaxID=66713 RepID=A0AA89BVK5_PINIB|nr:hypothetical protein FSP39_000461 [Pinctada imbricata]
MFGDYEAQRHWMEITYNLPVSQWYVNSTNNDLMYWGLDYPPLTAYHSWLCGYLANKINPAWVKLNASRGYESYTHKLFMRYSVIVADVMVYFPAVFCIFCSQFTSSSQQDRSSLLALLYPGIILTDHGHFQYNCISLGLTLLAVLFIGKERNLWGSLFFCLALNYKQMELYHALPFFCYLLGYCIRRITGRGLLDLICIGAVVVLSFAACWAPFLASKELVLQVLHRIFPVARGLYEDKVANVWCSLSVIVKLKQILTMDQLIYLCLVSTMMFLLPSAIDLLIRPSLKRFKYSLINSSLVFFLFSFHVHEKSILIPAVIVCLMVMDHPLWCLWFTVISTFSMVPLLIKDGLMIPYTASLLLYCITYISIMPVFTSTQNSKIHLLEKFIFIISVIGVVILSIAIVTLTPPPHLPDLFPVLISLFCCGHYIVFLLYFYYHQFTCEENMAPSNVKISKRKKKQ